MYKNILLSLFIVFLAGCSAPKPQMPPSWFKDTPTDSEFYYAAGAADTLDGAKLDALESMRESLKNRIENRFSGTSSRFQPIDKTTLEKIFEQNSDISKKLSLQKIKIERTERFKEKELVLISIARSDLFEQIRPIGDRYILPIRKEYDTYKQNVGLKKFVLLDGLMENFAQAALLAEYKNFLLPPNALDELLFLKNLKDEYEYLKSNINIYVLSNADSIAFAHNIKEAISAKGLIMTRSLNDENSIQLLITSETSQMQEYNFLKSKSLVKFTLFDNQKNQVAFRQHTFIGQSLKSYADAKEHASSNMRAKIKKLDLFNFIGVEK